MRCVAGYVILCCALLFGVASAANAIWPSDRHPLLIDAQARGDCPAPRPMMPRPIPVLPSDARRIV